MLLAPLQTYDIGNMLVGRCLILVSPFPARQIPDLKSAAAPDESHFAFQVGSLAKFFRQNEAALAISGAVLGPRM